MNLTRHTDYGLRVLLYLAAVPDHRSSVPRMADFYQISANHLVKVVRKLSEHGFVETLRGKQGGVRLAQPSAAISIGEVVRRLENHFHLVECFEPAGRQCSVAGVCGLQGLLARAQEEFLQKLDDVTLVSLVTGQLRERVVNGEGGAAEDQNNRVPLLAV